MKPGPAISTRLKCVSSKAGIAAATASAILRGGIPNTRAPAMAKLEARSPFFTSFGTSTTSAPRFNLLRIEEELSMAHLRLSRTLIEHLDWHQCIERYDRPHTLFYCDPPYWGTEGYGVDFPIGNYIHMSELARSIKGKMIISVNDIPEMRQAFKGLNIQTVCINYSLSGKSSPRQELVICNF